MGKELIRVVAAVIEEDGHYLITQRRKSAVLPLLWEFPGGRVEDGETEEDALSREVRWRIGTDVTVAGKLGEHHHVYEHYDVHMTMFSCHLRPDHGEPIEPQAINVNDVRWVVSSELKSYQFPPADERTMSKLLSDDHHCDDDR